MKFYVVLKEMLKPYTFEQNYRRSFAKSKYSLLRKNVKLNDFGVKYTDLWKVTATQQIIHEIYV